MEVVVHRSQVDYCMATDEFVAEVSDLRWQPDAWPDIVVFHNDDSYVALKRVEPVGLTEFTGYRYREAHGTTSLVVSL